MSSAVRFSVDEGLATVRLDRPHGNAINADLVAELAEACRSVESDPGIRGVLLAARGKLFCPGLDLQELCALDRAAMELFVRQFESCVLGLYALSKPMVAAIHGHAIAGGCVLALTADRRVLRAGAWIGLNEVRVGVPLPFGVAVILRDTVPRAALEEVALLGNNFEGAEAVRAGLAHEIRDEPGFEDHCRQRLAEFCSRDLDALRVTKRYLRAAAVERIRQGEERHLAEFLDGWFHPETRRRVEEIVHNLRGPG